MFFLACRPSSGRRQLRRSRSPRLHWLGLERNESAMLAEVETAAPDDEEDDDENDVVDDYGDDRGCQLTYRRSPAGRRSST
jgi:hypothetical protein